MPESKNLKAWLEKTITEIEIVRDEMPFGLDEDQEQMLAAFKLALLSINAMLFGYNRARLLTIPDEKEKNVYDPTSTWGSQCVRIAEVRGWNAYRAALLQKYGDRCFTSDAWHDEATPEAISFKGE